MGSRVEHKKHGPGKVECFLPNGSIKIEFDNGAVHRYRTDNADKIQLVDELVNDDNEHSEDESLTLFDLLLATPAFVCEAIVLWPLLSLYPPLADKWREEGEKHGGKPWYLLEVPCLKFHACFTVDCLFFVSLTMLSQPRSAPWLWEMAIDTMGTRTVVLLHLLWAASIFINEADQFFSSKAAELDDLRKEVVQMIKHPGNIRFGLVDSIELLRSILYVDQIIDAADLFGPAFAVAALADWAYIIWDKEGGGLGKGGGDDGDGYEAQATAGGFSGGGGSGR